jgi:hypothetical protein
MWLDIFKDGKVYEMDRERAIQVYETKKEVEKLLDCLQKTQAGKFAIAPPEKEELPILPPSPQESKITYPLPNNLAGRIIKYMQGKRYEIATGTKQFNIVYVEGMNADGTLNDNIPNCFNDRRIVIGFVNGTPKIVGNWDATSEPGGFWTEHPMNPRGAARIEFGQYKAWQVGVHNGDHRALVQVDNITVCRDLNKDYKRTGDDYEQGTFGINQHWGYDMPSSDIGKASAGCLVGRTTVGHQEFMELIEQDSRYLASPIDDESECDPPNHIYLFASTIISGDNLLKMPFP